MKKTKGSYSSRRGDGSSALLHNEGGAILLILLIGVTILGILGSIAGTSWKTIVQRNKEKDLLWKGGQIRNAIGQYYEYSGSGFGSPKAFPTDLESLLKDKRFLETRRHLRRLYLDPMTGEDWVLVKDPVGRIMGVHSGSTKEPFKQDAFSDLNKDFAGKQSYSEWLFVYEPTGRRRVTGTQIDEGPGEEREQSGQSRNPFLNPSLSSTSSNGGGTSRESTPTQNPFISPFSSLQTDREEGANEGNSPSGSSQTPFTNPFALPLQ